jgi:hypothetical protein
MITSVLSLQVQRLANQKTQVICLSTFLPNFSKKKKKKNQGRSWTLSGHCLVAILKSSGTHFANSLIRGPSCSLGAILNASESWPLYSSYVIRKDSWDIFSACLMFGRLRCKDFFHFWLSMTFYSGNTCSKTIFLKILWFCDFYWGSFWKTKSHKSKYLSDWLSWAPCQADKWENNVLIKSVFWWRESARHSLKIFKVIFVCCKLFLRYYISAPLQKSL